MLTREKKHKSRRVTDAFGYPTYLIKGGDDFLLPDIFNLQKKKLEKHGYTIKKDKLIIDYRIKERPEIWDKFQGVVSTYRRDYELGFWCYTNDTILYTNLYCSKEDFDNYLKEILDNVKL